MDWLFDYQIWASLGALTVLEIVLGIDNIVFISLIANHLPEAEQRRARVIGLGLALLMRIILLFSVVWVLGLQVDLFMVFGYGFSGKDLLLLGGGLFLLGKATSTIHDDVTGERVAAYSRFSSRFGLTIAQISLVDFIFSFDAVIMAVGVTPVIGVIIAAMVIAMCVMLLVAGLISRFIDKHPTLKMLALAFVFVIGIFLVAEGLGLSIPKGYIYFGMAFSLGVECLNILRRRKDGIANK